MPSLSFSITSLGLELPVLLGIDQSAMRTAVAANKPIPRPLAASALLDTGADITCIDQSLLRSITNVVTGKGSNQTASGQQNVDLFDISLSIPSSSAAIFTIPALTVMELSVKIPHIDVLLGMDVVNQIRVIIDGPKGVFELHY